MAKLHGVNSAAYLHAALLVADRKVALMQWDFEPAEAAAAPAP